MDRIRMVVGRGEVALESAEILKRAQQKTWVRAAANMVRSKAVYRPQTPGFMLKVVSTRLQARKACLGRTGERQHSLIQCGKSRWKPLLAGQDTALGSKFNATVGRRSHSTLSPP